MGRRGRLRSGCIGLGWQNWYGQVRGEGEDRMDRWGLGRNGQILLIRIHHTGGDSISR